MKKTLNVLFLQGQYPERPGRNPYFGRDGNVNRQLDKICPLDICWHFIGGHITHDRKDFWDKVARANVLFTLPSNMDHEDVNMDWHQAESSMAQITADIKTINPTIKIFFYEEPLELSDELSKYGEFINDLHKDEALLNYFTKPAK